MKITDITKYLPVGSLSNYSKDSDEFSFTKLAAHALYAFVLLFPAIGYPVAGVSIGEWNPAKQYTHFKRDLELRNQIFGEGGLADTNKDGRIDSHELSNLYDRMGVDKSTLNNWDLYSPTLKELEKAAKSYEVGKK